MTFHTLVYLECQACPRIFPSHPGGDPAPAAGAIYTVAMLRSDAREEGWRRMKLGSIMHDLCPRCAPIVDEQRKGKR